MLTIGLLTAVGAMICWAISVFPFTKAGRIMTVESLNLFRLVLATILVSITAIIFNEGFFRIFSPGYLQGWLWLAVSGIVALGIGDYFGLKMYAILSPRFGSVLTTLSPAMALVMGIILLNEHINFIGICGMAVTIIGVMAISLGRKERSSIPDHGHGSVIKGIVFGIISAFCNGSGLAFSKKGFLEQAAVHKIISPLTGSFIRFIAATIFVLIIMIINNKLLLNARNIKAQSGYVLRLAATGVLFGPVLAVSFALLAIQQVNVAVAQTIFALVPVVALLISHIVYKEKITLNALTGIATALLGIVVLIWRENIAAYIVF